MSLTKTLLIIGAAALLSACAGEGDSNSDAQTSIGEFDYTAMLANYADNIIVPKLQEQRASAASLSEEIGLYCDALQNNSAADPTPVQTQWRDVMGQWQQLELLQVGPLTENGGALRNRIYAYGSSAPLSSCAVDQAVVLAEDGDFDLSSRSFNSRGLAAVEYLLFNDNLAHTCPAQIPQTANWNQRPQAERRLARCEYAEQVAQDVEAGVQAVESAWRSDQGDYRFHFVNPANSEESLKALSDALFYIELASKDAKLGVPLSIHADCSAVACPDAVESPYAQNSIANIHNNLKGFKQSFNGADGLGFDDIIRAEGFADIAADFNQDIDNALTLAGQIDESLLSQSERLLAANSNTACLNASANPEVESDYPACQLHGYLKRINDRLRTDFITIVNLDLPERGQSDND
ncbi:imelysin family protein [Gilvimarinus chinensis]|uniref:imelysin family protein n=1 Tax=Gilvimarinus chinensis TaxID=396005 RepID=UPI000364544A|nr:imelysin family protein [Gilvimarinus chinensis]